MAMSAGCRKKRWSLQMPQQTPSDMAAGTCWAAAAPIHLTERQKREQRFKKK